MGQVAGVTCDIRVPEAIADMIDTVWADGGALTGLVNNAAGNFICRAEELSARGFDAISNIVFRGSFFVTLECGKRWLAEGKHASGPDPHHLGLERRAVHGAVRHVQGRAQRHDPASLAVEWATVASASTPSRRDPSHRRYDRAAEPRRCRARRLRRSGHSARPQRRDARTRQPVRVSARSRLGLCERSDHRHRRRFAPARGRLQPARRVGRCGVGTGPQRHPRHQRTGPRRRTV